MYISAVIKEIENFAPLFLQEKWDNSGLQVGTTQRDCTGVLVCFDVTPEIVDEAIDKHCNLIVSHHPLFFKPVKRLTGETPQQVSAMNAIAAGITIYSSHTATDSTKGGVSYILAKKLGITPMKVVSPLADKLVQLQVVVPDTHVDEVRAALFDAGAGEIGDYDCSSFNVSGKGTFRALEGADPFVGEIGETHTENETLVTVVLFANKMRRVEQVLLETHPYETPAYSFIPLLNKLQDVGLGIYGTTDAGMTAAEFVNYVKKTLGCESLMTTAFDVDDETKIRRVAMCGGSAGEFIPDAIAVGAQVYISADIRYHDFVDYQGQILVIDAGHYETEKAVKEAFKEVIQNRFGNMVPVFTTEINDNPIKYF